MDINELNVILEKHKKWVMGEEGGEWANLAGVDLSGVDLTGVNLSGANLTAANLSRAKLPRAILSEAILIEANLSEAFLFEANLSWANLTGANLFEADLTAANLFGAILSGTKLSEAKLCGVNLSRAYLRDTDLRNVRWDVYTAFYSMACPEEGAFIGWKKANGKIVKLHITEDAKRSSATSRKCRCSKAEVLEIQNLDGSISDLKSVSSNYDSSFLYTVGETVEVPDFDDDRWDECSQGIHFFITRQEAVNY